MGTCARQRRSKANRPRVSLGTPPRDDGTAKVTIPAGTQSGTLLRVRGKGLPRLGGNGVGDLHVRVQVWTPKSLNEEQRRLFAELAEHEGEGPEKEGGFWSKLKEALGA